MQDEEIGKASCWMMRVLEWDEPRARYPNLWRNGMPRTILALERVASRLRLGDLIAIYYPTSSEHPDRSDRFIGLSTVAGLRRAEFPDRAWIDLESAHRFQPPLDLGRAPRRVFLCCDPGWPDADVSLFRQVYDAAAAGGWRAPEALRSALTNAEIVHSAATNDAQPETSTSEESTAVDNSAAAATANPTPSPRQRAASRVAAGRSFAGADFSGDMRDPRERTWLAQIELREERFEVSRLEPTGRSGLEAYLRSPDRALMQAEAIGLDFPFGLPQGFAEFLLGGRFPEEGWWALARRLERMSRPDFLTALHDFREASGEVKRLTDEQARAFSPLHRSNPDLGPMTFHGVRMIAEDRSRYAIRPFESAQGKLLLEVYPAGAARRLGVSPQADRKMDRILEALAGHSRWPLVMEPQFRKRCLGSRHALDAVMAAWCAAVAVLTGEVDRKPEELAPDHGELVRLEGWIYGLGEPA